jgi:hypothetical protein
VASIGTPLDNAIGYGCWHVARLLVTRGAKVDKAWHAAALGMLSRLAVLTVAVAVRRGQDPGPVGLCARERSAARSACY